MVVFAISVPCTRRLFWDYLGQISHTTHEPWVVRGVFNSILYTSKKRGGSSNSNGVCDQFNKWFRSNRLYDLKFKGPSFT